MIHWCMNKLKDEHAAKKIANLERKLGDASANKERNRHIEEALQKDSDLSVMVQQLRQTEMAQIEHKKNSVKHQIEETQKKIASFAELYFKLEWVWESLQLSRV